MTIAFQAGLTRLATGEGPAPSGRRCDLCPSAGDPPAGARSQNRRHVVGLSFAVLFTPTLALWNWARSMPAVTLTLLFALLASVAFWAVDVNTFSLQNLYRNRLVRCYLGAAHHRDRLENPYAGFDPKDDLELRALRCQQRPISAARPPRSIMTQGAERLAWRRRTAASFLFSPRWCGVWLESTEGIERMVAHAERVRGGYVRTARFVSEPAGFRQHVARRRGRRPPSPPRARR